MRVAVIFFGQPRYIRNGFSARSHKKWLKDADVQFFGHMWFDENVSEYPVAPWGSFREKVTIGFDAPLLVRRQYPGISLSIEKPLGFDTSRYVFALGLKPDEEISELFQKQISNLSNNLSQFYSIKQAYAKFQSVADPEDFDLVVLSRFDNLICKLPAPQFLPIEKLSLSNLHDDFPDLIFMGPWNLMKNLDAYDNLEVLLKEKRQISAENLKKLSFLNRHRLIDIHPVNVDIETLRGDSITYLLITLPLSRFRRKFAVRTRIRRLLRNLPFSGLN